MDPPPPLPTSDDVDHPSETSRKLAENRLSTPFKLRMAAATSGAFLTGLALGLSHGGKSAGMRFRAESSHRFPTTPAGWYLYHKSKNYHVMLGGVKEGAKMGSKIAFWSGSFFMVEEAIDRYRGTKDFLSTVVASLTLAGGFSAWSTTLSLTTLFGFMSLHILDRFSLPAVTRTAKTSLMGGLAFGLIQDVLGLARGRRLAYVDVIRGKGRPDVRSIETEI